LRTAREEAHHEAEHEAAHMRPPRRARLVGIGVLVGAAVSVWASQFVASLLYGLEPRDPITLVAAALMLGTVGAFAGWVPAYRASRIDPAEVLRDS